MFVRYGNWFTASWRGDARVSTPTVGWPPQLACFSAIRRDLPNFFGPFQSWRTTSNALRLSAANAHQCIAHVPAGASQHVFIESLLPMSLSALLSNRIAKCPQTRLQTGDDGVRHGNIKQAIPSINQTDDRQALRADMARIYPLAKVLFQGCKDYEIQ